MTVYDSVLSGAVRRLRMRDDTVAGQVTPGKPGASAVSNTLIDWVLAHSTGRAAVPTPRQLGAGKMY